MFVLVKNATMLRFSETKVLLISPGKSGSITLRILRALVSTVSTYASFFQSQYLKLIRHVVLYVTEFTGNSVSLFQYLCPN